MENERPKRRSKDEQELFLLREFLRHSGDDFEVVKGERPDFRLKSASGVEPHTIGVELREYQGDGTPKRGSPGRAFHAFYLKVLEESQRVCAEDAFLSQCEVGISMHPPEFQSPKADCFVKQVCDLLMSRKSEILKGPREFRRKLGPNRGGDFEDPSYDILKSSVQEIRVHSVEPSRLEGPFCWQLGQSAFVGFDEQRLIEVIQEKDRKQRGYDWQGCQERWLLIAASAVCPTDTGGTKRELVAALEGGALKAAVNQAGFTKVIYWDRARQWHLEIPNSSD